jgi:hypothetical protein
MINKPLFLITILFALVSCSNSNSENKQTVISYEPEKYQEQLTDTLLDVATDLRLLIKYYTLMDKGFEVPFDAADKKEIVHYRDFAADITLKQRDKIIYSGTLKKEFFKNKIESSFFSQSYLSSVSVDRYDPSTVIVKIRCMLVMIESDSSYIFHLIIDKDGNTKIELIEEDMQQ